MQMAGLGINLGQALGGLLGGGKSKKAAKAAMAAGRANAAAVLLSGEEQAQSLTQNAMQANFDASIVAMEAKDDAQRVAKQGRMARGQMLAAAAASGAGLDASVMDLYQETLTEYEVVAQRALLAGELQKKTLRQRHQDLLTSAQNVRRNAKSEADKIMADARLEVFGIRKQRSQEIVDSIGDVIKSAGSMYNVYRDMTKPEVKLTTTKVEPSKMPIGTRTPIDDAYEKGFI